ncbi:MAG TPA: type II secretion system secretin GspD [Burkholderiales bacterium]|nr:type II secretion system secretin GspD [Burkholderiales bacterium]
MSHPQEDGIAHWLAARALSFVLAAALCSAALAQPRQQQRLTLNFVNTDIEAVARAMADFTGRTFIVDPRVKGTVTLMVDQPVTPDQALAALTTALRLQSIALVDAGGVIRVVPEADARMQGGPVQSAASARGDEIVTQIFRLNYESAVNIAQVLRPLVSTNNPINAYAGNNTIVVTDYAENVRRIARIIAAIDTPAGSEVDVIPLQYAIASDVAVLLARLLEQPAQAGADAGRVSVLAEPSTNTLLVRATTPARANLVRVLAQKLDQPSAAPGNIHVVYLKNANAANLARTLLGIAPDQGTPLSGQPGFQSQIQTGSRPVGTAPARPLTGAAATPAAVSGQLAGAQIQADPATNTLIIIAPDAVYRSLRAVIDKLDTRRAQVFIESLIIEVTSDQAAEFGIQWQAGTSHLQGSGGAAGFAGTNFGTTGQNIIGISQNPATVGTGLSIGVARGQITLPGIGTVTNLQFLARALESMSKANILSTPNILTLDNEEARIIVGQNVPFVTGQFVTSASSGAATVNPFQTVERRDVGLTLRVRPQISESGTIKLVIYQEVSSVQDTSNPAGIITNMRAIETNVLVDDGSIVVLGGLVQDSVTSNTEKVPVLGDIPLIGQLFRFETRRQQKTNLMVFLRPFIVREDADVRGVTIDRYDAMRRMEEVTTPAPHPVLPEIKGPVAPAP